MSLAIDVDKVDAVLIGDQWYRVENRSFDLDSYEYMEGQHRIFGGGYDEEAGVPSTGFKFKNEGRWLCGPLTAIQAVSVGLGIQARKAKGDMG